MKRIILTGGGTAGHVTPNLALIPRLLDRNCDVHYIGTEKGIERALIEGVAGITYHAVSAGKLRRYFSIKNFADPFRVIKGMSQAAALVRQIKPDVIFSKGGFVSVPVVAGGRLNGVPVIVHESDIVPGLANKLCTPVATKICVSFEDSLEHIRGDKGVITGTPIRAELYNGKAENGFRLCGFTESKPTLLVMGGSLGAKALNDAIAGALPRLLTHFNVVHLCGKGKADNREFSGYKQFEYLDAELPDVFALADAVVSRAGANAIFEFLALKKPSLLVPLPKASSRGDQLLNAAYFEKRGFAKVAQQETLDANKLLALIQELFEEKDIIKRNMDAYACPDGTENVLKLIFETAERR